MKKLIATLILILSFIPVKANHSVDSVISTVEGDANIRYQIGKRIINAAEPNYNSTSSYNSIAVGEASSKRLDAIAFVFNNDQDYSVGNDYDLSSNYNSGLGIQLISLKKTSPTTASGFISYKKNSNCGKLTVTAIEDDIATGTFEAQVPVRAIKIESGKLIKENTRYKVKVQGRFSVPKTLVQQ